MEPYPIRLLKNANRGREIMTVLFNYGFGDILERTGLLAYLQWGRRLLTRRQQDENVRWTTAQRIRLALQDLGPTFVKFGQVLSTRPDLLPRDLIAELKFLQERVPPFPVEQAKAEIERTLGKPACELFATFSDEPLAAGSLGQVHLATDRSGRKLAIKIRRPGVVEEIERDISLLTEAAQLIEYRLPEWNVFDPVGLVQQFSRTVRREMNYQREARTMQEFKKLFAGDPRLHIPEVDESRCSNSVLTMEYIAGARVTDKNEILNMNLSPKTIARHGAELFMRQAFEFGVFHGDPHPGNLRVERDGTIALLDFGMIGFLDERNRDRLVDLLLAVNRHDVDAAMDVVLDLGKPTQPVEYPLLRADLRDFIDMFYGVELNRLDVGQLLNDFIGILSNHGLRCPGDLMLLIRAIVTSEGIGRQLDPQFNLAEVIAPQIEAIVRKRYDPRRMAERAVSDLKKLFKVAHDLPLHLGKTLQKASQGELKVQFEHRGLDRMISEFDKSSNRIVVGVVVSSLIVSSALIIRTTTQLSLFVAIFLFFSSGLLGLWLVIGILRSGRL